MGNKVLMVGWQPSAVNYEKWPRENMMTDPRAGTSGGLAALVGRIPVHRRSQRIQLAVHRLIGFAPDQADLIDLFASMHQKPADSGALSLIAEH